MSTPAQKPRPSARRITTCVPGSRPAARSASPSSNQPATGSAFTGGKSMVTVVTATVVWVLIGMVVLLGSRAGRLRFGRPVHGRGRPALGQQSVDYLAQLRVLPPASAAATRRPVAPTVGDRDEVALDLEDPTRHVRGL